MHFSNIDSHSILKVDFSSYTWRSKIAHLDDLKYIKCTNFVLKYIMEVHLFFTWDVTVYFKWGQQNSVLQPLVK